jgi:Winged helix-turn helix
MAERVRVREVTNAEGNRLLRTMRRDSESMVTWRRAQVVLLSAEGMDAPQIAEITFTSADRVRDVIHNFNTDGFDSLRPRYASGGRRSSTPTSRPRSSRSRWPGRPIAGCRSRRGI